MCGDRGLAVIQSRFDVNTKTIRWSELDPWLANDIYTNPNFKKFLEENAKVSFDGLYPTITIRKLMWELKMKPLPKESWEQSQNKQSL